MSSKDSDSESKLYLYIFGPSYFVRDLVNMQYQNITKFIDDQRILSGIVQMEFLPEKQPADILPTYSEVKKQNLMD